MNGRSTPEFPARLLGPARHPIAAPGRGPENPGRRHARPLYSGAVRKHTDYALARRALLRDLERGTVTRLDVCDAHPELLRAARHVGDPADHRCPVCSGRHVRFVSYVYGDQLRQANGRCIVHPSELERLDAAHEEYTRYVVEVCPDCGWNFLTRRELHGNGQGGSPRRRAGRAPARRSSEVDPRSTIGYGFACRREPWVPWTVEDNEMAGTQAAHRALGAPDVVARKGSGTPLVMVTAYDAPSARAVDTAGVDMILVGDSVAMVVLGYDDTLHVTVDDMVHHTGAVARTKPRALVVADLPWMSYHLGRQDTVANAARSCAPVPPR